MLTLAVPKIPPQNVTVINKTTKSIFITWDAVPANQRHGKMLGYKVNYSLRTKHGIEAKVVSVHTIHVNLTGLRVNRKHNITVFAYNQCGDGPLSAILVEKTDEDSKF